MPGKIFPYESIAICYAVFMSIKKQLKQHRWPEGAIVYQIYPRSFYDANKDGIGDIPGITQKLDYLEDLGVNAIWLSPFYPSPMADFGYDVADYVNVDPIFGKLSDMDELIKVSHKHGIKIIVDLVPNHSSDEHEWFRQSRQSRENKYSDWYIWRDPKGKDDSGKPVVPNNWLDIFTGETAWEWEPAREQFYLHSFDVHQPDLNWANPEVREAIKSAMRFWLDRGVDGFRVDAVRFMGKDPLFKNNPPNPHYKPGEWSNYGSIKHIYSQGRPQMYAYLAEMAAVLKEKKYQKSPRFMVTESYPETRNKVREYLAFYEGMDPKVAAPFNFEGLGLPWEAEPWMQFLGKFHKALDDYSALCVASYAFGNHDQHRLATRLGDSAARSASVLLLTLPGMSFIYNGEEIGMVNGHVPQEMVQDPAASGGAGRDPERTPMQWTGGKNAGFSNAKTTWLPVANGYEQRNVESENNEQGSFLTLYKSLTKLRNKSEALRYGDIKLIKTGSGKVLCFKRSKGKQSHIILINFSIDLVEIKLPASVKIGEFQISSDAETLHKDTKGNKVHLLPNEAAVFAGGPEN
jgi:alpha-glucosidase